MREFWQEFCNNYNNSYWWADHPELRVLTLSVIGGLIGLIFVYFEARIQASVKAIG